MVTCARCQTENPDDARLCRECGGELPASQVVRPDVGGFPVASASGVTHCPSCGQPAAAGAEFCARCGKRLTGAEYAGFWRRLGGYLIDLIIVGIAAGIPSAIVGGTTDTNAGSAVGFIIGFGYTVFLNANGGTLGKRALGMRLEDATSGEDIGFGKAIVRYFVAIASLLLVALGYFWSIWDDKNQTWHDKAAGSVVVKN